MSDAEAPTDVEPLVYESRIKIPYRWSAGETGSRFLSALRDERKILGLRCPACRKVYVPPRRDCPACFETCSDWVEVGPEGTLMTFTQAGYDSPTHPTPRPVYGLIRLDGADTALLHLLAPYPYPPSQGGRDVRVRAVFRDERRGHILDILHFEAV